MSSYTVIKISDETGEVLFLMNNAVATKTFKSDISNAWTRSDHRIASRMMTACIEHHEDLDKYEYLIDDLDESPEW